jgi:hypothetical protein
MPTMFPLVGFGRAPGAGLLLSRRAMLRGVSGLLASSGGLPPRAVMAATRGATYYVSPVGDDVDGDGSKASPWGTLSRAYSVALAGDTICLRGGTYALTGETGIHLTGRSGTPGNRISIVNYTGETPIIDGKEMSATDNNYATPDNGGGYNLSCYNVSWLHIRGIKIKGGPMGGITVNGDDSVGSHNNIFENLDVYGSGHGGDEGKGITLFGYATNNVFLNCDSHDNVDKSQGGADGFQICPHGFRSKGNILQGCRAWNNSDDGFDLFNVNDNFDPAPVTVDQCWAWGNGYNSGGARYPEGDGNGFKLGGVRMRHPAVIARSGGHNVRRCIAWGNAANGFDDNGATIGITIYNCTGYDNCKDRSIVFTRSFYIPTGTAHVIRNCLHFTGPSADTGSNTATFNSWNTPAGLIVTEADFASLDDTAAVGARGFDGSLPSSPFLQLASGSNCLDAGISVDMPYSGAAPDLGAFERAERHH